MTSRAIVVTRIAAISAAAFCGTNTDSAAAQPVPLQEPPVMTWESTKLVGGALFGVTTAWVPNEDPVEGPPATGVVRPNQAVLAVGQGVFTSQYGDVWIEEKRPGAVNRVMVSPGGKARYASGADGVWRSENGGQSWSKTRVREADPAQVLALSPDWDVDKAAYAGTTADGRLYKSERGRASWAEIIVDPGQEHWTAAAAFSPVTGSDETVFVATDVGIFKSTNNGQIWTKVSDESAPGFGPQAGPPAAQGLLVSPDYGDDPTRIDDPLDSTLFAYNSTGVFLSADDGVSWRRLPLDVDRVNQLAVSPGWPRDFTLMAAVSDSDGSVGAVSEDGGETWRRVAGRDGLAGTSVAMAIDYAPRYRGKPRNGIFLPMTAKNAPVELGPPPPVEGSREAFLTTDGDAVWRTRDAGRTWARVETGITGVVPTSVALLRDPPNGSGTAFAGTAMSGLYRSADGGRTWTRFENSGLPRGEAQTIHRMSLSPSYDRDGTILMPTSTGVWLSRDRGEHWARGEGSPASRSVGFSPTFEDDGLARVPGAITMDGGATWQPDATTTEALTVAFSPTYADDQTLWMGGTFGIQRSTNGGESWVADPDNTLRNRTIYAIVPVLVPRTVDPLRLFAATGEGVVQGNAPDFDWFVVGRGPSQALFSLVATYITQPVDATLFAAGEDGVGYSVNRGIEWARDRTAPRPSSDGVTSADGCVFLVAAPEGTARARVVVDPRCAAP